MATAIADIAVVMIDYQVPVPEQYGSKMLGPWSSCSDFPVTKDDFKKHILKDSTFLEALMEAMRIKVIPSEIQRQLELQQARIDTQERGSKRKEKEAEDEVESRNREAKKVKVTSVQVNNNPDNECVRIEEGKDFDDGAIFADKEDNESASDVEGEANCESKMSDEDNDSKVAVLSKSERNTDTEDAKENQKEELQVPACEENAVKDTENKTKEPNEDVVAVSASRKQEMKTYVIGNLRPLEGAEKKQDDEQQRPLTEMLSSKQTSTPGDTRDEEVSRMEVFEPPKSGDHVNESTSQKEEMKTHDDNDDGERPLNSNDEDDDDSRPSKQQLVLLLEEAARRLKITVSDTEIVNQQQQGTFKSLERSRSNSQDSTPYYTAQQATGHINETALWTKHYFALKEYREKHGNCNVPTFYPANKELGIFVKNMRYYGKLYLDGKTKTEMNADRFRLLDDIDFIWFNNAYPWDEFLSMLRKYKQEHGHCNVPKSCKENQKLGALAHSIRLHAFPRRGMTLDLRNRKKMLKAMGFRLEISASSGAEITKREQHHRTLDTFEADLKSLGATRNSTSNQSKEKMEECETWMKNYRALKEYKEKHGDCKVPTDYPPNKELSRFVTKMRYHGKHYLDGKATSEMNAHRFRMLDKIDFIWYHGAFPWYEFISMIQRYRSEYGHCNVPKNCKGNQKLGVLAHSIRQHARFRKGLTSSLLTADRKKLLKAIGFSLDITASSGGEISNWEQQDRSLDTLEAGSNFHDDEIEVDV